MTAPLRAHRAHCRLCGDGHVRLRYEGPVRAGQPGRMTTRAYAVLECAACGVAYLDGAPEIDYEDGQYRIDYNGSDDIAQYFALHDRRSLQYAARLSGQVDLRGKTVADIGCGGGALLDALVGVAARTIAVEPLASYHESLRKRGHEVYAGVAAIPRALRGRVDVVTSLHVIEHVDDPVAHLDEIHELLVPGGTTFVLTPNADELLVRAAGRRFEQFFYRTAHRWYLTERALRYCLSRCRPFEAAVSYEHNYPFANAVRWLGGDERQLPADDVFEAAWKAYLERAGLADTVWLTLVKRSARQVPA